MWLKKNDLVFNKNTNSRFLVLSEPDFCKDGLEDKIDVLDLARGMVTSASRSYLSLYCCVESSGETPSAMSSEAALANFADQDLLFDSYEDIED